MSPWATSKVIASGISEAINILLGEHYTSWKMKEIVSVSESWVIDPISGNDINIHPPPTKDS